MFIHPQKVLFKHCDPAGIVFYPRYFEMMNDCVEAFFAEIGHPFEQIHRAGAVPTVNIDARFPKPSRHGDDLTLLLQITRLGTTSLALNIDARCADELRMGFTATLVHVDSRGKPSPWSAQMRSALSPYLKDED